MSKYFIVTSAAFTFEPSMSNVIKILAGYLKSELVVLVVYLFFEVSRYLGPSR